MKLTDEEVAEYFRKLKPEEIEGNPAVAEAGRASIKLRKTAKAGPGRPPTVRHKPKDKNCRCADCRRAKEPSYRHKAYRDRIKRGKKDE